MEKRLQGTRPDFLFIFSFLLMLTVQSSSVVIAQCELNQNIIDICRSDPEWRYSPAIYPVCAGSNNPDGSLSEGLACAGAGAPYQQDLTVVLPDSIEYQGFALDFNYAILKNPLEMGLPEGMHLSAEGVSDWTLEDDSEYCLMISGTANEIADYSIALDMQFCAEVGGVPICVDTIVGCYQLSVVDVCVANRKLVDVSGTERHSVMVVPNPFSSFAEVRVSSPVRESVVFSVYDLNGVLVRQEDWMLEKGDNQFPISSMKLSAGTYFYGVAGIGGQFLIID